MNNKIKIIGIIAIIVILIITIALIINRITSNNKIILTEDKTSLIKNQSLSEFEKDKKISIDLKINELLEQDNFQIFTCTSGSGENRGLVLNIKLFERYDNLYQDTVSFMLEWEKTLIRDTYNELLPNLDLNTAGADFISLDQNTRYAEVYTMDKTKKDYNYSLIPDAIIISSSMDCTKELINYYFPSEE